MQEHKRAFKHWRSKTIEINYMSHFRELQPKIVDDKVILIHEDIPMDIVADLMTLKVGSLYTAMSKDLKLGYLPPLAQASKGQIGTLNAESVCERGLSFEKLVMTEGNTLLSNEETEMINVLRMNQVFMDYMRTRSPHTSKQRLNQTVVSPNRVFTIF